MSISRLYNSESCECASGSKTFEFLLRAGLKSRIVTIRNITKLSQWFPASRRAMTGDRVNDPKGETSGKHSNSFRFMALAVLSFSAEIYVQLNTQVYAVSSRMYCTVASAEHSQFDRK